MKSGIIMYDFGPYTYMTLQHHHDHDPSSNNIIS